MSIEQANNGIVTIPSRHSADETINRLKRVLEQRGVKLFAIIDHSGEAEKAALQMPNTKLLIFGSPKAGTPLMLATPTIAIDLPLKILVSEDADSKVWVTYNSPEFLRRRHNFPAALEPALAAVTAIAREIAE